MDKGSKIISTLQHDATSEKGWEVKEGYNYQEALGLCKSKPIATHYSRSTKRQVCIVGNQEEMG